MDLSEAIARANAWSSNPRARPTPQAARDVAAVLADHVMLLEEQLTTARRLASGREVFLLRGNPNRGPDTGSGFGRKVPALIVDAAVNRHQVCCRLLIDDPAAVGKPCRAGDEGWWSASQVVTE